jgi:hypothetical protein
MTDDQKKKKYFIFTVCIGVDLIREQNEKEEGC